LVLGGLCDKLYRMHARTNQILLIVSLVGLSWFAMQAVHELGHVIGATASGGQVKAVVLHPLVFSRTDLSINPNPLLVAWAGPLLGCLLPLCLWVAARRWGASLAYLFRFFAGFCFLANGVYIGVGSFEGIGDAGDLLRAGAAPWQLIGFGLVSAGLGLLLWNGLGARFGLGRRYAEVDGRVGIGVGAILVLVVVIELVAGKI